MSMRPLNAQEPLGQFDLLDTEMASILGGEVVTFTTASRVNSLTEQAAADALDGYLYDNLTPFSNRPAVIRASAATEFPLYLVDDGLDKYGSNFGQTIGTPAGLSVTGTNLGPHSAAASGKVTLWGTPGLYSVSVDALAPDFVSSLTSVGLLPGASLGFLDDGSGKLAHSLATNALAASGVANFVEFESSGSLVTTPERLVGAAEQWPNLILQYHAGSGVRAL